MTTLILENDNGVPYTVEAVRVEALLERVSVPLPPTKRYVRKGLFQKPETVMVSGRSRTELYAKDDGLKITTAEIKDDCVGSTRVYSQKTITIEEGVGFAQYAKLLTQSPNGVVNLRPFLQANRENAAAPAKEPTPV